MHILEACSPRPFPIVALQVFPVVVPFISPYEVDIDFGGSLISPGRANGFRKKTQNLTSKGKMSGMRSQ
jgi:hypothetical protein